MDPRIEQKVRLTARRYAPGDQAFEDLAVQTAFDESRGKQKARSPKGAIGVMQLMPGTASDMGVDPHNEDQNIDGGVRYLFRQYRDFGDPKLARAAYNAGPGAVRKYGGVPPYAETQKYVGGGNVAKMPSAEELLSGGADAPMGSPQQSSAMPSAADLLTPTKPAPVPQRAPVAAPKMAQRTSQRLGFEQEFTRPYQHVSDWITGAMDAAGYKPAAWVDRIAGNLGKAQRAAVAAHPEVYQAKPGAVGGFAGSVAGSSPLMFLPGGALVQGGAIGAVQSDQKDLPGVLGDAAVGAVTGKIADAGVNALGKVATRLLSGKAAPDQIMALARNKIMQDAAASGEKLAASDVEVRAAKLAKSALYDAVDQSGFRFQQADVDGLVNDFRAEMGKTALSKEAKGNAQSIIDYARTLKNPSLSEMEKLRGDIYEALNKKGGDNAVIGGAFRSRIDGVIDRVDNGLVRQARAYNARFKKADYVNRASQSADLAAEKTYGGDYGRKLKDRIAPLVDPLKTQRNFRGATPDETAALNKVARGTRGQKIATEIGAMTDPRRMGGKILSGALGGMTGTAGVLTGGASLPLTLGLQGAQLGIGLTSTGIASNIARNNLDDLIRLITSGGSRQALAPVPTAASRAADQVVQRVARPAAVAAVMPAIAASRRDPKPRDRKP